MGAMLGNASLVHHKDLVGVAHGLQPVGNHDDGLLPGQGVNGVHQILLVFRVHVGGGLVQDDDGRILHDGTGDGDSLLLAPGQAGAPFPDDRVVSIRQLADEVVAAGFLGRLHHVLVGCVLPAELDVVLNGIRKQVHGLEHKGEVRHQAVHAVVLHVNAAQGDVPCVHVPEPGNQAAQGGFAPAGRSHKGGGGSLGDGQGHVVDDLPAAVGEGHVVQPDVFVLGLNLPAADVHGVQVQDGIGLVHAYADRVEQGGITAGGFKACEEQKGRNGHADGGDHRHIAGGEQIGTAHHHQRAGDLRDRRLQEVIRDEGHFHLGVDVGAGFVGFIEPLGLVPQQPEGLDLRNALNVLHHLIDQLRVAGHLAFRKPLACLLHPAVDEEENPHPQGGKEADAPVRQQDHHHNHGGFQNALQGQHDHPGGHIPQGFHGVGGYGRNLPDAVGIKVSHGQIPQVLRNPDAGEGGGVVACLGLQHGGIPLAHDADDDRPAHHQQGTGDVLPHGFPAHQPYKDVHHGRHLHGGGQGFHQPDDHGQAELPAVFLAGEAEELGQNLKHGRSPPLRYHGRIRGLPTYSGTGGRFAAAPHGCLRPGCAPPPPRRSGRCPSRWIAGGR